MADTKLPPHLPISPSDATDLSDLAECWRSDVDVHGRLCGTVGIPGHGSPKIWNPFISRILQNMQIMIDENMMRMLQLMK
jgi:hypothetical protein